jgi:hypothetical protein
MQTFGKLVLLAIFFGIFLWAAPALTGEKGTVSCSTPDCGYHSNLTIGGGMKSPSVTGYCRSTKQLSASSSEAGTITGKLFPNAPIVRSRSCRFMIRARLPKFPVPNAAI